MKRITVFCGSSFGTEEIYKEQATLLGETLAGQNIELVMVAPMLDLWVQSQMVF